MSFQKSGAFLLVKNEGTLGKKLAPLGYAVEWKEFPSGPPIFEALSGNDIDLGHSGDGPVIFAQSNGVPCALLGITDASPESAGIIVSKRQPLKMLADIKGRKAAFVKGSSAHYHLARALPVTPEVIAEQQGVADTFFKLGLLPKAIDVKEVVY